MGSIIFIRPPRRKYRYLRFYQTANVGGNNLCTLFELDFSNDGGSTWLPTQTMTANNAPSPLVALADSENAFPTPAYFAFTNGTNLTGWSTTNTAHPHWLQIDLGAGHAIRPTHVRYKIYNTGGSDRTPKDFTIRGSNDGFSSENIVLLTVTGDTSGTHQSSRTKAIP